MPYVLLLAFALLACSSPTTAPNQTDKPARRAEFDIKIVRGTLIDGTGTPGRAADVGIRDNTIVAVGDLTGREAATTIDATGLIVAPGFIDLLGNSQSAVLIDPRLEGKIRQGVTTEVTGEGHSPAPIDEAMAAEMERTKPPGWPAVTWRSMADFMNVVEKRGTALNFAFFVGATNPREIALGHAERAPTAAELKQMEGIVETAMREGAVGIASALIYPPGRFATTSELTALAAAAGRHGGAYWTHLRNEADRIDAAIDEAIAIGRGANVPVNIFHLKIGGRGNWGRMPEVIARIERARASGLDIAANMYPFTATSTDLVSLVPAWAQEGGYAAFVARLRDPATRKRVREAIESGPFLQRVGGAEGILIRGIPSATMKQYERKTLGAISKEMKLDPAEAAIRLFEESTASPVGIYFSLSENDLKVALQTPWIAFGSDSGAVVGEMRKSGAHPRAYATFSRVFRYVREEKLITMEEAVRRMTSLAASRAGLLDRGKLSPQMKADIVVFDPNTIRDRSTYEDPHHFSEGVVHVVVNGKFALRDGKMTGELPGRVLRKSAKSS